MRLAAATSALVNPVSRALAPRRPAAAAAARAISSAALLARGIVPQAGSVPNPGAAAVTRAAACPSSSSRIATSITTAPATTTTRRNMATDNANGGPAAGLRMNHPVIFICDMQEKFKSAIHEFDKIVLTTKKLLAFAKHFSIPVQTTTQTVAKLGPTVAELAELLPSPPHDKTLFSMAIPPIRDALAPQSSVALVGIESHICITQTALDLRDAGHRVYVLADGVSSCNSAEVTVALDRLRAEPGVTVTSSESWMYQCVGDAAHPAFKGLLNTVKASYADTKAVLSALPPKI